MFLVISFLLKVTFLQFNIIGIILTFFFIIFGNKMFILLAETEQGMGEWSSGYSTCMNNNDINSPQVC